MPCTSLCPLIGWPYCSPVMLRNTSVPLCLNRTASSRSQNVPLHCTVHTSRSSPSPLSPNALTSCGEKCQTHSLPVGRNAKRTHFLWGTKFLTHSLPVGRQTPNALTSCDETDYLAGGITEQDTYLMQYHLWLNPCTLCKLRGLYTALFSQKPRRQDLHATWLLGQRWGEVVGVQVPARLHVGDADGLAAADGHPSLAHRAGLPPDAPVAVSIICCFHSSDRLLPATCREPGVSISMHRTQILYHHTFDQPPQCIIRLFTSLQGLCAY